MIRIQRKDSGSGLTKVHGVGPDRAWSLAFGARWSEQTAQASACSRHPADLAAPEAALGSLGLVVCLRGQRVVFRPGKHFANRTETHFSSPFVDLVRIFEFADLGAIRRQVELRAKALRFSFEHPNSIIKVGELPSWNLTDLARCVNQRSARTHEVGFSNCVLQHEPSCLCAFVSHNRFAWPTMRFDDGAEFICVGAMDFFHSGVVAIEQATVGLQFSTNPLVPGPHIKQAIFEVVAHLGPGLGTTWCGRCETAGMKPWLAVVDLLVSGQTDEDLLIQKTRVV
jgi:hypothetical protein